VILADVRELSGPVIGINANIQFVISLIFLAYGSRPVIRCLQCYTQTHWTQE